MPAHNDITRDAIQTRPVSKAYADGFDLIRNPPAAPGCVCSWRERALGDGCQYCNPAMAEKIRQDNLNDPDQ